MGFFDFLSGEKKQAEIVWQPLSAENELAEIDKLSKSDYVMIYKHSTTCGISSMVLSSLERKWEAEKAKGITPFFLDLLRHRALSNFVAEKYGIRHESPQVLMIRNGKCVWNASHTNINFEDILEAAGR